MPIGISIGKSKVTPLDEAAEDYLASLRLLAPYADYVAVNVSSPNTPGLRALQDADSLTRPAHRPDGRGDATGGPARHPVPVFVKLAPDLTDEALEQAVDVVERSGAAGLIATNTTLSRAGVDPARGRACRRGRGTVGCPADRPRPRGGGLPGTLAPTCR